MFDSDADEVEPNDLDLPRDAVLDLAADLDAVLHGRARPKLSMINESVTLSDFATVMARNNSILPWKQFIYNIYALHSHYH